MMRTNACDSLIILLKCLQTQVWLRDMQNTLKEQTTLDTRNHDKQLMPFARKRSLSILKALDLYSGHVCAYCCYLRIKCETSGRKVGGKWEKSGRKVGTKSVKRVSGECDTHTVTLGLSSCCSAIFKFCLYSQRKCETKLEKVGNKWEKSGKKLEKSGIQIYGCMSAIWLSCGFQVLLILPTKVGKSGENVGEKWETSGRNV